ncbi:NUDIX hydrolase [Arcticibacterium luteifluviistationis]|uniref:DNA mismatch repair protein MutT n=1 Tax=Arcticibacterium luteifluviistationis TaxID=1784714 RepID=A0A2Z4GBA3_9BACT|nr:NUDIX domain-containing protein [Arcticibacterium luteifluviistationis]AWV98358.1 DNA mismatch repair protein MutT [Arcticibacterium luteifluviistationis]
MLELYSEQTKCLVALDSIIFGFDGSKLKLLLVKRGIEESKNVWSLMGGWLQPNEGLDQAANRILENQTGLQNVYLEQVNTFGAPDRDPVERTVSVTYFALINVADYDLFNTKAEQAKWFDFDDLPELLFDHEQMVKNAIQRLRNKAAFHPLGFELLPEKFTLPQLQVLYEAIFDMPFDKRNFSRKILSSGLLTKLDEKQKGFSKKGAYLYKLNSQTSEKAASSILYFVPSIDSLL